MKNFILNNCSTTPDAAADAPQPAPVTADAAIEQIRTLRAQLPGVATLPAKQRKGPRNRSETSEPIVQASLNVIGVSDMVSSAIGLPIENVRAVQPARTPSAARSSSSWAYTPTRSLRR
jgi:hypothetical protein